MSFTFALFCPQNVCWRSLASWRFNISVGMCGKAYIEALRLAPRVAAAQLCGLRSWSILEASG
jgi:hypothetical protein